MPNYRCLGEVPAKRHTIVPRDGGGSLFEELMGSDGFSGESALLYHRNSPSALLEIEAVEVERPRLCADTPLQPRHLRTGDLSGRGDAVLGRELLLGNRSVQISWVHADRASGLFRDAAGDQLLYVQEGTATFESGFGSLPVGPGDYVVIPRGLTHQWAPGSDGMRALVVEASGHVRIPERYLATSGQFREGAPFCERDLRVPAAPLDVGDDGPVDVLVRNRAGLTRMRHAHHPFDVVGWDGGLYPYAFNIADFEPIVGAVHQPPPVHQTFAGPDFVVCSFVPRLFDFLPGAIKVPYHHSNVDSDEVLFYSRGNFMSRAGSGIGAGSISFHPAGFVHGPQPGSVEAARDQAETHEYAVMIDTFEPLHLTDAARAIADPAYPFTWARRTEP
jgi:homogentisate 1,2-dioxygenase